MKALINGINIEYETAGARSGVPVVFIHGFPFSKETWKPQVEVLKKNYYTVTFDVRGHGGSDVGDGQYTVEYFVDDLFGLLEHLKLSKVIGVGLSMGGYILLRAAERHPNRFRGLVLCDTRSEADNNEGKVKRALQAKSIKTDGVQQFAETFLKSVFYEKTFQTKPDVIVSIRKIIEKASPISVAGTLIALAARTDCTPSLYTITVPTLILVGQYDSLTPPSAAYSMKEKIPQAQLYIIPDAAHVSNLENPEEFNRRLIEFLNKLKNL